MVCLLDESACSVYEQFVEEQVDDSFYYSLLWRDVLVHGNCGQPRYLLALQGDHVRGVLPLFEAHISDGCRALVSLPATPAAGTLSDDVSARWLLASRALALAQLNGFAGVLVRTFCPSAASDVPHGQPDWLRIPIATLLALPVRPDTAAHPHSVAVHPADADDSAPDASGAPDWIDYRLPRWRQSRYAPLRVVARDDAGRTAATAICLLDGRSAHVLTYRCSCTSCEGLLPLLQQIGRLAAERGAARLDFPAPPSQPSLAALYAVAEVSRLSPLTIGNTAR